MQGAYTEEAPSWLVRLYHLPARNPWRVLGLSVLLGVAALFSLVDLGHQRLRLTIDSSVENLLPSWDTGRKQLELMRRRFGDEDLVFVAFTGAESLSNASIKALGSLALSLRQLPGVRSVNSLADASLISTMADEIQSVRLDQLDLDQPAVRTDTLAKLKNHAFYGQTLISDDGSTSAMIVSVARGDNEGQLLRQSELVAEITRQADAMAAQLPGARALVTGTPVIEAATAASLLRTLGKALPAIIVIMALIIGLAFLDWRALLMSLLTIVWSVLIMLGVMALLHRPINVLTAMAPPVVCIIGLTYAIYLLTEYQVTQGSDAGSPAHYRRLLDGVGMPLLVNGLSTAAGFLALAPSPLPAISEFALLSAFGVLLSVTMVLGMLPSLLHLTGAGRMPLPGDRGFRHMQELLARLVNYRGFILAGAAILALVMAYGATQIVTRTDFVADFEEGARVRSDYETINARFGGVNPVYISLRGPLTDYFVRPEVLLEIEKLGNWLARQPEVGKVNSLADEVKLINQTMNDGHPDYYTIPGGHRDDETIKQLLLFGGGEELKQFVDAGFRNSRIVLRLNVQDSAQIDDFMGRVEARLAELPEGFNAHLTGMSVMATRVVDGISAGQWFNIGIALLFVYVFLSLLFTSWVAGLIAIVPSILPLLIYYGLLGFFDVPLNPTTSLISCIVLGIAADDSVRFFAAFNARARELGDEHRAAREVLESFLRPMSLTAVALCLGFLTLMTSELRNQAQFGMLAALTLTIAWLANMTVTPALAAGARIVTLWDTLRLDLGEAPHRSIPLFDGLTWRQARIFALLSEIQKVPANTRVITEGEQGGDIFLVIDGDLKVWVDRDGKRVDLSVMRRGNTLGEIGHFSQRRSANVDAVTPVRMLRFNDADLERMVRRYPRIAAIVLRNLNRIQAVRISNNISKLG